MFNSTEIWQGTSESKLQVYGHVPLYSRSWTYADLPFTTMQTQKVKNAKCIKDTMENQSLLKFGILQYL